MSEPSEDVDLWHALPDGVRGHILSLVPFRDLARAACACRSMRAFQTAANRLPAWKSATRDVPRSDAEDFSESACSDVVEKLLRDVQMPQRPSFALFFTKDLESEDEDNSPLAHLGRELARRLPPSTVVVGCCSVGVIGPAPADPSEPEGDEDEDEGGEDKGGAPPRFVERDPSKNCACVALSLVALGDSVNCSVFVCPREPRDGPQELTAPLRSPVSPTTPVQVIILGDHPVMLRHLLPALAWRLGGGHVLRGAVGGISSHSERATDSFLAAGPALGKQPRSFITTKFGYVALVLHGPGLQTTPVSIKGARPIGDRYVVKEAYSAQEPVPGRGDMVMSIVSTLQREGGGPELPIVGLVDDEIKELIESAAEDVGGAVDVHVAVMPGPEGRTADAEIYPFRIVEEEGWLVVARPKGTVSKGDVIQFVASTPQTNRDLVAEMAAGLPRAAQTPGGIAPEGYLGPTSAEGLLAFICNGRGESLYGEMGVESRIVAEARPDVSFTGIFSLGEFGPAPTIYETGKIEPSGMMGFTSVYCHVGLSAGKA